MFDVAGAQPPSGSKVNMNAPGSGGSSEVLTPSESHLRSAGTSAPGGGKRQIEAPKAA